MNKFKRLFSVIAAVATIGAGVAGITGCGEDESEGGGSGEHQHNFTWVDNGDGTHKQHCDVDGCDIVDKNKGKHTWGEDDKCTQCGAENPNPEVPHEHDYKWVDNGDGTHKQHCFNEGCDNPDIDEGDHEWGDEKCDICNLPRPEHIYSKTWKFDFDKHYKECTDEGCENPIGMEGKHNFKDGICEDCGARLASYEFIPSDQEAQSFSANYTSGIFTISSGASIRTRSRENKDVLDYKNPEGEPIATGFTASKSVKIEKSGHYISINANAAGKWTLYFDNGSTSKPSPIQLVRPDSTTERIDYPESGLYGIVIDCPVAGEYKIARVDGTTDIYYSKFEAVVEVTPVKSIKVADNGKDTFIKGEEFDFSRLQLQAVRSYGVTEPIDLNDENLKVDYSAFDGSKAGSYKINVSYEADGKTHKANYTVNVFEVEDIEIGFNKMEKDSKNTAAGNGQYINHTVRQFYFVNEDLSDEGLTVKAVIDTGSQKLIVTEGFEFSGFEKGKAGKQTVRVFWADNPSIYKEFDIYVAEYTAVSITEATEIQINVDGTFDDNKVGVRSNGAYQFKTVQQSLDFLNGLNLASSVKKVINVAAGTYTERLEVTIPNLTIKGEDKDTTMIEWDSLVGLADESGFVHVTDSTATLNVRDKAVGFVLENITVSNWYNSEAHFTEKLGAGYGEHRALAMLVQADKVVIDNCNLLGYQDTIEFFTGRQIVQNTYICGRTDFIFGTNNTTYFKDCTIESIVDGGYVTAFKGCNKGDNDWVQYGAIFDGCEFIAPSDVLSAKNTSLGRTWGKYAAVAYINCDFGAHISTKGYASGGGTRYTAMNGLPTDETVKFVEYNNKGDGAVSSQVAGMTMLTSQQAEKYLDFSVIFATTNGALSGYFTDVWDGTKGV